MLLSISLSPDSTTDALLIQHLLSFKSGKGVQARSFEIKRMLLDSLKTEASGSRKNTNTFFEAQSRLPPPKVEAPFIAENPKGSALKTLVNPHTEIGQVSSTNLSANISLKKAGEKDAVFGGNEMADWLENPS